MPTQPISNPTSRAETSIETSASVTLLTSPHTTRAKPCEHFGRVLLFTNFREQVFSETVLPALPILGNSEGIRRTGAVRSNALLGGTLRTR
jgi:hypothetical protein